MPNTTPSIEERLQRIETALHKILGTAAPAEASGRVQIAAHSFNVVDSDGTTRAMLLSGKDGSVHLRFCSPEGELKLGLGLGPNSLPSQIFIDAEGKPRMSLQLNGEMPELIMVDADGTRRIDLSLDEIDAPSIGMFDGGGRPRAVMLVDGEGQGRLMTDNRTD